MDLLHLCFCFVCLDHVDPVPICYRCLIFWKDTRRKCDLQDLQSVGRSLVPFDIYLPTALLQNTTQQIKAIHFCDQSQVFA